MNKTVTDEFSFILKPSSIPGAGIGVFITQDIDKQTHLCLSPLKEGDPDIKVSDINRVISKSDPILKDERALFLIEFYCVDDGDVYLCPKNFNQIPLVWYLNHSTDPNIYRTKDFRFYSLREIKSGEELFINYQTLSSTEASRPPSHLPVK